MNISPEAKQTLSEITDDFHELLKDELFKQTKLEYDLPTSHIDILSETITLLFDLSLEALAKDLNKANLIHLPDNMPEDNKS